MIIASFPRSGNHLVRYIIEYISMRSTLGEGDESWKTTIDGPIFVRVKKLDYYLDSNPIAEKRHTIRKEDFDKKLLLIVRDFKSSIIRHGCITHSLDHLFSSDYLNHLLNMYYYLLEDYNKWEQDKCLIYYEDLMKNPEVIINKISNFISISTIDDLINDYSHHFNICKEFYNDDLKIGPNVNFVLNFEQINYLKNWFINRNPRIAELYLRRYYANK